MSRQRVGEIVADAAALTSEKLTRRGLPPLPRTTPHTLRRTYISIALLGNNFDVKWVMSQVGHADSKMTLDVCAQLEQRAQRQHGRNFDQRVRRARNQLHDTAPVASEPGFGTELVPVRKTGARNGPHAHRPPSGKTRPKQALLEVARPGLEPGTPRFSVVCSTS
jgi:hypothetical protein